jgi:hypothetical protein
METAMEKNEERSQTERPLKPSWFQVHRWGIGAAVLLLIVGGLALSYGRRQGATIKHLTENQGELSVAIGQMHSQLNSIASTLDEMSAAQIAAAQRANAPIIRLRQPSGKDLTAKPSALEEERWKQVQARMDEQQRQLNQTEVNLAKTRSDLEGSLNSTYEQLNGSIAKTHEELVALERRGERNYFEFDLSKGNQFQRWGPMLLSLRKADPQHQTFDLVIIANDKELTSKKVNLYAPIWIYDTSDSQPVQVVVNQIYKNLVHGYVSAPKYKQAGLSASSTQPNLNPTANLTNPSQ